MPDRSTIESLLQQEADRLAPGQPEVDFETKLDQRIALRARRRRRYVALAAAAAVVLVAGGVSAAVALTRGPDRLQPAAPGTQSAAPKSPRAAPKPANASILKIAAPVQVRAGSTATVRVTMRTHAGIPVVTKINWGDGTGFQGSTAMRCPGPQRGRTLTMAFTHRWTRAGRYTVTVVGAAACTSSHAAPSAPQSASVDVVPASTNAIVTSIDVQNPRANIQTRITVTAQTISGRPIDTSVDWGDGAVLRDLAACPQSISLTGRTAHLREDHTWKRPGIYTIRIETVAYCGRSDGPSATATKTIAVR